VRPRYRDACACVKRSRTLAFVHPLLALALVVVAGIGVTRLSRFPPRYSAMVDDLVATGAPYVLLGALLGPGLGVLDVTGMHLLEPLLALGIGWIGAAFGARIEWRMLRTVPRRVWWMGLALALPVFLACALAAWFLARNVPPLAEAWRPQWPAILTLAAAATMSAAWSGPKLARRTALLDTIFGALAAGVALVLYQPTRGIVATLVASAGLGALCTWLLRPSPPRPQDTMGIVVQLFGVILSGSGLAYATGLSPFFVCGLTTAFTVNASDIATRHVIAKLLNRWERPLYAAFLILAGALLGPLTVWLLPAGLALAGVVVVGVNLGVGLGGMRAWSPLHGLAPDFGFETARQGGTALAVAAGFDLVRGGVAGATLATVLIMILVGEAIVAAAPTPLTASPRQAEVS